MITDVSQRWDRGEARWRPVGEHARRADYDVVELRDDATPKAFVCAHHYEGSYPAALRRFGLMDRTGLVGVCVFDQPVQPRCLDPLPCGGIDGAHLARLVLLDRVPGNGESLFVGRVFETLARDGYSGVVSFSDPMERRTSAGRVVTPGHVGAIYQALDGAFLGRTKPERRLVLPDGTIIHNRALAKIRKRDQGWRYAAAKLVAHGAAPLSDHENARLWLARWLPVLTRSVKHPGNYRYAWTFQRSGRERLAAWALSKGIALLGMPTVRYPKRDEPGAITRAA